MTDWTEEERDLCAGGYVYLKDTTQAKNGLRARARSLEPYDREDLVFDRPAVLSPAGAQALVDHWDSIGGLRTSAYYRLKQIAAGGS